MLIRQSVSTGKKMKIPKTFLLLVFIFLPLFAEESSFSGSYEDGNRLIDEGRCLEAEKLSTFLLEQNPSDPNAELLITRSWLCLGKDENRRKNHARAIQYLLKAQKHWPLNTEIKSELDAAYQGQKRKIVLPTAFHGTPTNSQIDRSQGDQLKEIKELLNEILNTLKESKSDESKRERNEMIFYSLVVAGIFLNLLFKIRSRKF